jgi:hypothetical protein
LDAAKPCRLGTLPGHVPPCHRRRGCFCVRAAIREGAPAGACASYHEPEGSADPSVGQITSDLTYIRDHSASDPSFLKIRGRFVIFVWARVSDGCGMADRWKQANTVGAYVVLKVFTGYTTCASQPDGWHQYGPGVVTSNMAPYSFTISASTSPASPAPGSSAT